MTNPNKRIEFLHQEKRQKKNKIRVTWSKLISFCIADKMLKKDHIKKKRKGKETSSQIRK